jgi:hypothetical protein
LFLLFEGVWVLLFQLEHGGCVDCVHVFSGAGFAEFTVWFRLVVEGVQAPGASGGLRFGGVRLCFWDGVPSSEICSDGLGNLFSSYMHPRFAFCGVLLSAPSGLIFGKLFQKVK